MHIGAFVRIEGLDLGIGKLVQQHGTLADVEFFGSPASGAVHRETVTTNRISRAILTEHTRVYWFDLESRRWMLGRVAEDGLVSARDIGSNEDHYFVELPNKKCARVAESALHVRWDRPVDDPVAYLAARTTETPFWHQGRRSFMRNVVDQRARCGSLTGMWSAAIELERHQIETVQIVLTDPVQRYLLADEVGLGKTIEAAAILRQYVLDEPGNHSALIIAPDHLVLQWKGELRQRFYLGGHLDKTVHVLSIEDALLAGWQNRILGLLIIDEAHHPASMAFSADPGQRQVYAALATMAQRSPRLLLLSATPVLRNEDGFLAMLHLLDPKAYPLADREAFRHRVQNRQQLAEALSDLKPESGPLLLGEALDTLAVLTNGDRLGAGLIEDARDRLELDEHDPDRERAIANLREHIGEVYRLHRRLIRHRRENLMAVLRGRSGATVVQVSDPVRLRASELLDQWREQANLACGPDTDKTRVAKLYWLLLQAACSHPAVLRELLSARRDGTTVRQEFALAVPDQFGLLRIAEPFAGEAQLIDELLRVLSADAGPRLAAVAAAVRQGKGKGLKTVLFIDCPGIADQVARGLTLALGDGKALRHRPEIDLRPFLDADGRADVLVCDRDAEEGLNLQKVRAQTVHMDLPLDPGRIEQRMGRSDRFGARIPIASIVFAEEDPFADAWRHCVQDILRIFNRSVASLQYLLEDRLRHLREAAFANGVEAIEDLITRLRDPVDGIEAEERRIRLQECLDTMDDASEAASEWFSKFEDFDAEESSLQVDFDAWAVQRLQFQLSKEDLAGRVVRYQYAAGRGHRTLLSPDQFLRWCRPSLDVTAGDRRLATQRLSFDRNHALRVGAQLARIGHAFVDSLVEQARRDDRGVAHAMWRVRQGLTLPADPWLAFGFDYVVEADISALPKQGIEAGDLGAPALRRRLDATLPPHHATVWLDQELEPIEDPDLLAALEESYADRKHRTGRDYNLSASRWLAILPHVSVGAWDGLCFAAAGRALEIMKARVGLDERIREAEARIDERLERAQAQLRARISRLPADAATGDQEVLRLEESLAELARRAIRSPRLVPDSAFAVFLSTSDPIQGLAE